jgi:hypothetical protein
MEVLPVSKGFFLPLKNSLLKLLSKLKLTFAMVSGLVA